MPKIANLFAGNKTGVGLLAIALIVGGAGAQASGQLNTVSGGYLICVNAKTKIVTHPSTDTCPKGAKQLLLGAKGEAGSNGLTGAAGLSGKDGTNGKDGKTLWNGVKDPENTWGAPGDMFINSVTKTLFGPKTILGPKNIDDLWSAGVSMVGVNGPAGPAGARGFDGPSGPAGSPGAPGASSLKITELSICGAGGNLLCKVGAQGPGGGLIFFVDYNDQYAGFNYLEAAPDSCEATITWASSGFQSTSVPAAAGWAARSVGRGSTNTDAIVAADTVGNTATNASKYAKSCSSNSKTDWFLGSLGEMKLMYDNLQGLGGFVQGHYWSSSEFNATSTWSQNFIYGYQDFFNKGDLNYVRPVRAF